MEGRKEGNVLFNDALNTFYIRLYGIRHMVGVGKYPSFFHAPLFLWPNYEIKTNLLKVLISVNLLCRIMAKIQNGCQN